MRPEMDYSLYVCTDRDIMTTDTLEEAVELAIKGGHYPVERKRLYIQRVL